MNLVRIAFRNLGRKKTRTALSILAVAVGVFAVINIKGITDGILEMMIDNSIRLGSGHVRIIDREYQVKERLLSLNYPVDGFKGEGYQTVVEALRGISLVEDIVPRLRFGAMVNEKSELVGVMAMGVEPVEEEKLMRVSRYITDGRFLQPGEQGAIMGYRILDRLGLKVGEKFTLVFTTALGSLKGYTFEVTGSLKSGLQYLDDGLLLVPLDVAQEMLDMGPAVTEILLMAKDKGQVPEMLREVRQMLEARGAGSRYVAVPWYQYNEIIKSLQMAEGTYNLVYFLILFLASFVVINTMVMMVNERRREIGMLSALGMRPGQILQLFILEGGIMGLFGSLAGILIGAPMLKVLSVVGIPIPGTSEMDEAIMITPRVYPVFNLEVMVFSFLAGIAVTLVAICWPARTAARMEPTQALRV